MFKHFRMRYSPAPSKTCSVRLPTTALSRLCTRSELAQIAQRRNLGQCRNPTHARCRANREKQGTHLSSSTSSPYGHPAVPPATGAEGAQSADAAATHSPGAEPGFRSRALAEPLSTESSTTSQADCPPSAAAVVSMEPDADTGSSSCSPQMHTARVEEMANGTGQASGQRLGDFFDGTGGGGLGKWMAQLGTWAAWLLCAYAVFNALVIPASWKGGLVPGYDLKMAQMLEQLGPHAVNAPDLLLKYIPHPEVRFTHILPSALWAAAIPLQLSPSLRRSAPWLHRTIGYMLLATSACLMVGVAFIDLNNLYFSHNVWYTRPMFWVQATWFLLSGFLAAVNAKQRNLSAHRSWAVRHVGTGVSVMVQRLLDHGAPLYHSLGWVDISGDAAQRELFALSNLIAWLGCALLVEVGLWVQSAGERRRQKGDEQKKRA